VLDNVKFNHCTEVIDLLNGMGLLFLPPYSPFLNPIVNSFSKWKVNVICRQAVNESELVEYIFEAVGLFCISDFQGYWRNMTRFLAKSLLREEIFS
jgi:transposase